MLFWLTLYVSERESKSAPVCVAEFLPVSVWAFTLHCLLWIHPSHFRSYSSVTKEAHCWHKSIHSCLLKKKKKKKRNDMLNIHWTVAGVEPVNCKVQFYATAQSDCGPGGFNRLTAQQSIHMRSPQNEFDMSDITRECYRYFSSLIWKRLRLLSYN